MQKHGTIIINNVNIFFRLFMLLLDLLCKSFAIYVCIRYCSPAANKRCDEKRDKKENIHGVSNVFAISSNPTAAEKRE